MRHQEIPKAPPTAHQEMQALPHRGIHKTPMETTIKTDLAPSKQISSAEARTGADVRPAAAGCSAHPLMNVSCLATSH